MVRTAPAVGFDTLSYARRLKDAGVDDVQAEAHAEAVRDAITEGVATKADIARLEDKMNGMATKADLADLRADFATLETNLDKRFAALETDFDRRHAALEADFDKRHAALGADLDRRHAALGADLDKLEARVDKRMAALETRLVRNVYTVAAAQIVIIVGLLKLIP